ncbi:hypothetical protein Tco_1023455 [Tanacetum coccineum]
MGWIPNIINEEHKVVKGIKSKAEGGSKAGEELESDNSKKQRIDEHDDQEEAEIKKHMEIVQDDEVAIDAIPLSTKPLVIVEMENHQRRKDGILSIDKS